MGDREFSEWLESQPEEVRREFEDMELRQRRIDNRELPVSQIYFGDKPVDTSGILNLLYSDELTEMQRKVLILHIEQGKTQQETANILGINRRRICQHITAIRKKLSKILKI